MKKELKSLKRTLSVQKQQRKSIDEAAVSDRNDAGEESESFAALVPDARRLKPSTQVLPVKPTKSAVTTKIPATATGDKAAPFHFSDGFEAHWPNPDSIFFVHHQHHRPWLTELLNGHIDYSYTLDLHGLNQQQAKEELSALLERAIRKRCIAVRVVHGVGKQILKQRLPNWLLQHPAVLGFTQPRHRRSGRHSLLVLLTTANEQLK